MLRETASAGLLREAYTELYELHATLPPFLLQKLLAAVGQEGVRRLNEEFVRFYASLAATNYEGALRGEPAAVRTIEVEEDNRRGRSDNVGAAVPRRGDLED